MMRTGARVRGAAGLRRPVNCRAPSLSVLTNTACCNCGGRCSLQAHLGPLAAAAAAACSPASLLLLPRTPCRLMQALAALASSQRTVSSQQSTSSSRCASRGVTAGAPPRAAAAILHARSGATQQRFPAATVHQLTAKLCGRKPMQVQKRKLLSSVEKAGLLRCVAAAGPASGHCTPAGPRLQRRSRVRRVPAAICFTPPTHPAAPFPSAAPPRRRASPCPRSNPWVCCPPPSAWAC